MRRIALGLKSGAVRRLLFPLLILALVTVGQLRSGPAHAADSCVNPPPGGSGLLQFVGIGGPNHTATRIGHLCRGAADAWTFSTFPAPVTQYVGVRVVELTGHVILDVYPPGATMPVTVGPGEVYRDVRGYQADTYRITVAGKSEVLSTYRLEVCRGVIDPCQLLDSVTPKPLPGDMNCDGRRDAVDAALVLQFQAGLYLDAPCRASADVFPDGRLDSADATMILQFSAGLLPSLGP